MTPKSPPSGNLPRILLLVEDECGWEPLSRNLDVGGGPDDYFTLALLSRGVQNLIYDPFQRTAAHNDCVLKEINDQPADTATLSDVLNVIERKRDIIDLLKRVKRWVKPGGRVYFTVYEGNGTGRGIKEGERFQANRPLWAYVPLIRQVFPDAHERFQMIVATNP